MEKSDTVYCLVYRSSALVPFSKLDLVELLKKSRQNNSQLGITGMLLFKEGNFLQVLEGDEEKVRALYHEIAEDARHGECMILFQGFSAQPDFPDWSMGFYDLNSADSLKIHGYSQFLNTSLTVADFSADPGRAKKLLLIFKEDKWTASRT